MSYCAERASAAVLSKFFIWMISLSQSIKDYFHEKSMKLFRPFIPACMALLCALSQSPAGISAQAAKSAAHSGDTLKLVVILSRHGVRSPTQANTQLDLLSANPWPQWPVAPGELAPRGPLLLSQFAAWDRTQLVAQRLVQPQG